MAKSRRPTHNQTGPNSNPPPQYIPASGGQGLTVATLSGVVVLLVISFSNWRELDRIEETLSGRLTQIEANVAEVSGKVDRLPAQAAQAAQPARRGPDPNRVYQIKTAGAPVKGNPGAPVTIAEFSDFQ